MNFGTPQKSPQRLVGIGAVIALHFIIFYALVAGLQRNPTDIVAQTVDVRLIEDAVRTTAPAPPQTQTTPPLPKPPPATPRVLTPSEPAPMAQAATTEPVTAPVPSAEVSEPEPQATPAAAPPSPALAAPSAPAAAVLCPGYQEAIRASAPPREILAEGRGGEVLVEFTVTPSGTVRNPLPISSTNPRLNRWALHTVLTQIRCQPQAHAVQLRVPISVRFE